MSPRLLYNEDKSRLVIGGVVDAELSVNINLCSCTPLLLWVIERERLYFFKVACVKLMQKSPKLKRGTNLFSCMNLPMPYETKSQVFIFIFSLPTSSRCNKKRLRSVLGEKSCPANTRTYSTLLFLFFSFFKTSPRSAKLNWVLIN